MERSVGAVALLVLVLAETAAAGDGDALLFAGKVPLWLKVANTLFLCLLVPIYWRQYGPANFLWFSDIALFVTAAALWLESPLLAGTQAVAVAALELMWVVDFVGRLLTGLHVTGISKYMFKSEIPLFIRGLSLFHVWLPFLLLWLVGRLGYDPRAWLVQSTTALIVLLMCYLWTDPSENINWVFGPGEKPQTRIRPWLYLVLLMGFFVIGVYLPSHFLLLWFFPE